MVLHGILVAALLAGGDAAELVKRMPATDGRCYSNSLVIHVPYDLENRPGPEALLKPAVFYSRDGGQHWLVGAVDADGVSPATFRAPGDGEYWLRMGIRRLGDTAVPEFGRDREGVLVAVIDTQPPTVKLVPRLVHDVDRGPTMALTVVAENEPLEPLDVSIEVELPASENAPAGRHLWIERATIGREYQWQFTPDDRKAPPTAFHAVAVDQAGNVGRDALQMSLLTREATFRRLAEPDFVRPRVIRSVAHSPDGTVGLAAELEYEVEGPLLAENETVELWSTPDNGKTWRVAARHEDRKRPLVFTAPRPGLYGLRLVLRRGSSLLGDPPAAGTKPQLNVIMERGENDASIVGAQAAGPAPRRPAVGANVASNLGVAPAPGPPERRVPAQPTPTPTPPVTDRKALARAAYQRGNYRRLQGGWADACRHFKEAIRHDPLLFEAHNDLAGCLHQQGQLEEAARAYYRAIDLRPDQPDARFSLAQTLIRLGRDDEALSQLNEVVRLNPADGEAWLHRGDLLQRKGDAAGAMACWQKALDHAPANAGWSALVRQRLAARPTS